MVYNDNGVLKKGGSIMVKKLIVMLLSLVLLLSFVTIVSAEERADMDKTKYADALNSLGLFLGTDRGYELDEPLTREQAITLIVRFMGEEEFALKENYVHPFDDVSEWASPYVGFAYAKGITKGISITELGASDHVSENQFMTFLLRLIGYVDGKDFNWETPYALGKAVNIVPDIIPQSTPFLRGDAVVFCWRLLNIECADNSGTLGAQLMKDGVYSEEAFKKAEDISVKGKAAVEAEESKSTVTSGGGGRGGSSGGSSSGGSSSGGGSSGGGSSGGGSSSGGNESSGNTTPTSGNSSRNETEDVPLE